MATETVLVIGATGNIGTSAVIGALRSKRDVVAVVRNQDSAAKLTKNIVNHVGSVEGITFAEADVLSDTGIKGIVDQVRAGKLPSFRHVYSCVGGIYSTARITEITTSQIRYNMNAAFEANFFAYRDTIGYLLEQNHPSSTWTLCTGSQGDVASDPMPAMTQGPLFTLATAACRDNSNTNVRFNEVCLAFWVNVDERALENGAVTSLYFAKVYEEILANPEIRSARVRVDTVDNIATLKYERRF